MTILLSGEDTYRSRKRLLQLIAAFKKKFDAGGHNIARFSGSSLTLQVLQGALGTQSLLSKKKMVIIEGLCGAKLTDSTKDVLGYVQTHASDDCIVVLYEQVALPKTTMKHKAFAKATCESFELLEGAALTRHLSQEAKEKGVVLDSAASRALVERIGSDTWMLATTLDQLRAFAKGKTVSESDVAAFTETAFDENIFHFTDALGRKDAQTSLQLMYDQLQLGSHPLYILTMLVRQFRLLLLVSEGGESLGSVHPYVLQKSQTQARMFTPALLQEAFAELITMDAELKNGFQDAETLLTRFIVRIATA